MNRCTFFLLKNYLPITFGYGLAHGAAWTYKSKEKKRLYIEQAGRWVGRCATAAASGPFLWPLMVYNDLGALECYTRGMNGPFESSFLFSDYGIGEDDN